MPATITNDVTVTVTGSVATSILEYAGLEHGDDGSGWRTRDGRESRDPAVALTDALVAIAESDLAAELIEPEDEIGPLDNVTVDGDIPAALEQYRSRVGTVKTISSLLTPNGEVRCATVDFGGGTQDVVACEYLARV